MMWLFAGSFSLIQTAYGIYSVQIKLYGWYYESGDVFLTVADGTSPGFKHRYSLQAMQLLHLAT